MKTVSLSGSPRENVGKKDAKSLRNQGFVPCVIYGGEEQVHFHLDERDFSKLLFTPETFVIKLTIGDKEYNTLLQDIQYHPVTDKILHADFLEFDITKAVKVSIPINTTGASVGVLKGGSMNQVMRKLAVKALAEDIPEFVEVDISKLDIGDSFMVKDLSLGSVECLDRPNDVLIAVKVTRIAVEEEEEEEEEGEEGEGAEGAEGAAEGGDKPAEGGSDAPPAK
ncbi:MAG: 50S ribosomal protein L25/general stress protein Ctc [Bacteroidota bacterium]